MEEKAESDHVRAFKLLVTSSQLTSRGPKQPTQQNSKSRCLFRAKAAKSLERRFDSGSVVKNPPANAGDWGSIPGLGSSPGEGNGNPLQYSCLENSMDRGAWGAPVHEELDRI